MTPTRWRDLALLALAALPFGVLLGMVAYSDLPPLPYTFAATTLVLAVAELFLAPSVRNRLAGRPRTKPIMPMVVARTAAFAKASSALGALSFGFWLGLTGYLLPKVGDFDAARSDTVRAGVTVGSAVVLVFAALRLEKVCRAPDPPGDEM